jgi:host factor-I protein
MSGGDSVQNSFLEDLCRSQVPVAVFLINGIRLQGRIESFDAFAVSIRNSVFQVVYKHAISTIAAASGEQR